MKSVALRSGERRADKEQREQKDSKPEEDQWLFLLLQVTNCIRSAPSVVTAGVHLCVPVFVCLFQSVCVCACEATDAR